MGNKILKRCAFQDKANSFQKHVQTNTLERTVKHSNVECIRISHVTEAKERWKN